MMDVNGVSIPEAEEDTECVEGATETNAVTMM